MLVVAAALEALQVGLGFFLLGKVKPEKSTGAPLHIAGGGAVPDAAPAGSTNAA